MDIKRAVRQFFQRIDWLLLLLCTGLVVFGVLLHLGISRTDYVHLLKNFTGRNIQSQIIAVIIGVAAALVLANINYRSLASKWKFYVPAAYLLMLSTFVFGVATAERESARRWLIIPGINMSVQPSEFLKLAFILSFAYHVYKTQENFNHPLNILLLCAHAMVPVALIQYQGDSGTALMCILIFLTMIFMAGIKPIYMVLAGITVPAAVPIVWSFLLSEWQKRRIQAVLWPTNADYEGTYYQQSRAALAISSGKLTGNGVFNDAYSHVYVPEIHNDFIFAFVGDCLGFLGCVAVIIAIALMCVKILYNCGVANDKQGQLICAGVFAMIFFQSAINIFMCLSLMPVIGNSLPFISSGGSSVLANYLGIGLVLSVFKHTKRRKIADTFLPR